MKIIHIVDTLDPSAGGPANVAPSLAAAQASLGHKVSILCNNPKHTLKNVDKHLSRIPGIEQVDIVNLNAPRTLEKLLPINASKWLIKELEQESTVHLHGMWEPTLWIASFIARYKKSITVARPCSMLHPWEMKHFPWMKKMAFLLGAGAMLKKASFIHALNKDEHKFVTPYIGDTPVEIIPNGFFPEFISNQPPLDSLTQLDKKPYALFLGRLHHQKGLTYLADAFNRVSQTCKDMMLVVVGPDGGERQVFLDKIKQHDLLEKVLLTGPLYGNEKAAVLSNATCFCHPSLNEGFSNSIVEALAYGLPVVISKFTHFPEVEDASAGYILNLDAKEMGDAIIEISTTPDLRDKMSKNARNLAFAHYTWPIIATQTIETYEKFQKRRFL